MAPEISDAIIRVRDISVQFGATKVLDGLDLDVKRGEILGFVGPSGAGKSVLTRTIIGLVPKTSGSIEVFGVDLDAADARARRGVAALDRVVARARVSAGALGGRGPGRLRRAGLRVRRIA